MKDEKYDAKKRDKRQDDCYDDNLTPSIEEKVDKNHDYPELPTITSPSKSVYDCPNVQSNISSKTDISKSPTYRTDSSVKALTEVRGDSNLSQIRSIEADDSSVLELGVSSRSVLSSCSHSKMFDRIKTDETVKPDAFVPVHNLSRLNTDLTSADLNLSDAIDVSAQRQLSELHESDLGTIDCFETNMIKRNIPDFILAGLSKIDIIELKEDAKGNANQKIRKSKMMINVDDFKVEINDNFTGCVDETEKRKPKTLKPETKKILGIKFKEWKQNKNAERKTSELKLSPGTRQKKEREKRLDDIRKKIVTAQRNPLEFSRIEYSAKSEENREYRLEDIKKRLNLVREKNLKKIFSPITLDTQPTVDIFSEQDTPNSDHDSIAFPIESNAESQKVSLQNYSWSDLSELPSSLTESQFSYTCRELPSSISELPSSKVSTSIASELPSSLSKASTRSLPESERTNSKYGLLFFILVLAISVVVFMGTFLFLVFMFDPADADNVCFLNPKRYSEITEDCEKVPDDSFINCYLREDCHKRVVFSVILVRKKSIRKHFFVTWGPFPIEYFFRKGV